MHADATRSTVVPLARGLRTEKEKGGRHDACGLFLDVSGAALRTGTERIRHQRMRAIIASPKPEQETSFAPVIRRAKS